MQRREHLILSCFLLLLLSNLNCFGVGSDNAKFSESTETLIKATATHTERLAILGRILQDKLFGDEDKIAAAAELARINDQSAVGILIENIICQAHVRGNAVQPAQKALRELGQASVDPITRDIKRCFDAGQVSAPVPIKLKLERETLVSIMGSQYFEYFSENRNNWNTSMVTFMGNITID